MQPTRKDYSYHRQEINAQFQLDLQHLFTGTYNGTKSNNSIVTRILLACSAISNFNACQTYADINSNTLANALIKLLPDYVKLQQLINEMFHSQLQKTSTRKHIALPSTLC